MKIALDVTPLSSGHKDRGVGRYTQLLVEALKAHESTHIYTLFERGKVPDGIDLVHYPYFDPFFLTLPLVKSSPTVVTVHDLIPLVFPDTFPRGIRGEIKWQVQRLSLASASGILSDSESSKKDIVKYAGIDPSKIATVYLAADPALGALGKADGEKLIEKYRLPKRYFLYVGDLNWNKNVKGLLESFAIAKKDLKEEVGLALVGSAFKNEKIPEQKEIMRLVHSLNIEASVFFLGKVHDRDLSALYASSVACAVVSFYEGFGLPVIEAMKCKTIVLCSMGSSLDEIAGPSIRVEADDTLSIASQMNEVLNLPESKRKSLIASGLEWSAKYSWANVARETVAFYKSVVG